MQLHRSCSRTSRPHQVSTAKMHCMFVRYIYIVHVCFHVQIRPSGPVWWPAANRLSVPPSNLSFRSCRVPHDRASRLSHRRSQPQLRVSYCDQLLLL